MATQVQFRRGTTSQTETFIGALGEITVDTSLSTAIIHDGVTAGGKSLLRSDGSNSELITGTGANPSLTFVGDTNTGLFSGGADQVGLATGGSARLTIDSSGVTTFNGNVSIQGDLSVTGTTPDNIALIVALS
tara:strand:- start:297 stop:695 length:399 start_codon:yes stop_codon:yes gene_type:complete